MRLKTPPRFSASEVNEDQRRATVVESCNDTGAIGRGTLVFMKEGFAATRSEEIAARAGASGLVKIVASAACILPDLGAHDLDEIVAPVYRPLERAVERRIRL